MQSYPVWRGPAGNGISEDQQEQVDAAIAAAEDLAVALGHLVVGAAGYIPGTVYNPLRYANLLGLIMVPGLALHQSGSQQTEIRQAIETYARGKLAIW